MSIPIEQKIIAVTFSLILFAVILQLIRKHKLREEYALVWLAVSLAILLLSLFDRLLNYLAALFAVVYAPTLILVFGILFCLVLLLAQTVMLSAQANRLRDLAQSVGLLEWRLQQLEQQQSSQLPATPRHVNGQPHGTWSDPTFVPEPANESAGVA